MSYETRTASLSIARPANTAAYTANDVVGMTTAAGGGVLSFGSVSPGARTVRITGSSLEVDATAVVSGEANYRMHLYSETPPSALADNAAWDLTAGDRPYYLGYIDLGTPVDLGSTLYVQAEQFKDIAVSTSGNIFAYLVTVGAFTPASATVRKVTLHTAAM